MLVARAYSAPTQLGELYGPQLSDVLQDVLAREFALTPAPPVPSFGCAAIAATPALRSRTPTGGNGYARTASCPHFETQLVRAQRPPGTAAAPAPRRARERPAAPPASPARPPLRRA